MIGRALPGTRRFCSVSPELIKLNFDKLLIEVSVW